MTESPRHPGPLGLPIETSRLVLRRFRSSDAAAFHAYRNDPEVARWQSWDGIEPAAAVAFVREMETAPLGVPGRWFQIAIGDRAHGALLGDCAFCVSRDAPEARIGFTLARAHHGRGYGFEAVSALVGWLFGSTPIERVVADTDPANQRSWKLLERIGMRRIEHRVQSLAFKGGWADEYLYAMSRDEWLASTGP